MRSVERLVVWKALSHVGGCQNCGPLLGPYYSTAPINLGYPKRDPNFDNHPCRVSGVQRLGFGFSGLGVKGSRPGGPVLSGGCLFVCVCVSVCIYIYTHIHAYAYIYNFSTHATAM